MKLYEFEGKSLFREMGIPTPRGFVSTTVEEAKNAAKELGYPLAVKDQVLHGGRGKAGGIKFTDNEDELLDAANELLTTKLAGDNAKRLLVEEKIRIAHEFYAGITLDPLVSLPVLMISPHGGMDIEEVVETYPHQLFRMNLDPLMNPRVYQFIDIVLKTGLTGRDLVQVTRVLLHLVNCYFMYNAITAEINPLVIDEEGKVLAADSKIEIDDSALFRIKAAESFEREVFDPLEAEAKAAGLSYVSMGEGNIGLIAGGAGLGMASMDMIFAHGGSPANFLDLTGDANPDRTAMALEIVLKKPGVEGVLFNAFGGINNCKHMAMGISKVVDELHPPQVITVKMRGHAQKEGWALLEERKIPVVKFGTTEQAICLLLEQMKKKKAIDGGHTD